MQKSITMYISNFIYFSIAKYQLIYLKKTKFALVKHFKKFNTLYKISLYS